MSVQTVFALLLVVGLMVAGQILFKATAIAWQAEGSLFSPRVLAYLLPSLALYGIATLAWVWVLQFVELGRAYPFMALAFVLVPLLSMLLFGEVLGWRYYLGVLLICAGVVVVATA